MIEGIAAVKGLSATTESMSLAVDISNSRSVSDSSFLNLIETKLVKMNSKIEKADSLMVDFIAGKDVPAHELMIALGKAKSELQLAVEVRNRIIESYKEITRIQV